MNFKDMVELSEKGVWEDLALRESIYSRAQMSLTALVATGAALFFLSSYAFDAHMHTLMPIVMKLYVILIITAVVFELVAIYFLLGAVHENTYRAINYSDRADKVKKISEILKKEGLSSDEANDIASEKVAFSFFTEAFPKNAKLNMDVNIARSLKLKKCNHNLALTFLSCAILAVMYQYVDSNAFTSRTNVQKIEITNDLENIIDDTTFNMSTIEIDFSEDIKRYINERRQQQD